MIPNGRLEDDKGGTAELWGKDDLSDRQYWINGSAKYKIWPLFHKLHKSHKWAVDLNLKGRTVRFLEDVIGNYLLDFGIELLQIRKKKACKSQKKTLLNRHFTKEDTKQTWKDVQPHQSARNCNPKTQWDTSPGWLHTHQDG